jgi:hypothetical protein
VILSLIYLSLINTAVAQDDQIDPFIELKPEELPIQLKVPRDEIGSVEWRWLIMPEPNIDLLMARYEQPPVSVGFGWIEGFQPDLERLDTAYFDKLLFLEDETWSYDEERVHRLEEHPILGQVAVMDFGAVYDDTKPTMPAPPEDATPEDIEALKAAYDAIEDPPPVALDMRLMYYAVEGGAAYVLPGAGRRASGRRHHGSLGGCGDRSAGRLRRGPLDGRDQGSSGADRGASDRSGRDGGGLRADPA